MTKTRYALVGIGSRGYNMFARPLTQDFADVAELVALCDRNAHRLDLARQRLGLALPVYQDYARMLAEVRPEVVLVATMDATHHAFIIPALEAGCDVITEKPMTTTAENVQAILEAERRTGRSVRVSFNARYGAATEALYTLLRQGAIGRLISAVYTEYLNTSHGADYFRRWHRRKANSGGLLIHKASHHFDQLNWWIGAEPQRVFAMGGTRFYGPTREKRGERCLTCAHTATCEFYLDLRADANLSALYLQGEGEDGYFRDRCVFADEIDIEDSVVVAIRYANGVLVNYDLNAYLPIEGQRIGFNGVGGRLEVDLVDQYHGPDVAGVVAVRPFGPPPVIHVYPRLGRPYDVPVEERTGGHGGADALIREHLFGPTAPDPLAQRAGTRAGALSTLVGVAANRSIASGAPVDIGDLW
ncbi:MAG: Gfo/Idh/MocA family oxidoreductase [Chloroflexota bacterium]